MLTRTAFYMFFLNNARPFFHLKSPTILKFKRCNYTATFAVVDNNTDAA